MTSKCCYAGAVAYPDPCPWHDQPVSIDSGGQARDLPDPAEFERMLREKYEPILSPEDYARLREACGLGAIIDGEVVEPRRAIEQ